MKERYAFRYNEFLQQQYEKDRIFSLSKGENPLLCDVEARFCGCKFTEGKTALEKLGVRIKETMENLNELIPLTDMYGADALRIALIEQMPLTDENLTGCWRFIGNFWCALKTVKPEGEMSDFDVCSHLKTNDYKGALICLKSVINERKFGQDILMLSYPFMPHLVLSFDAEIHEKMPLFWKNVQNMSIPNKLFIEINGKRIMDFYSQKQDEQEIIKEALSFDKISRKIGDNSLKKVIFIPNKGVNFVI